MYKIVAQIEADGDKKAVYDLKETLLRNASQHSCRCEFTITSTEGFQEMMSTSFNSIVEVDADDIIDLSLTGDEMFDLLEYKKEEEK